MKKCEKSLSVGEGLFYFVVTKKRTDVRVISRKQQIYRKGDRRTDVREIGRK